MHYSETLACIKIIALKIQNVDFWAPPLLSALRATTLGNSDAGIPLKTTAGNNSAPSNVQCSSSLIISGTQSTHESLKPQRVQFQSRNFHNILQWQPGRALTGNSSVYFVQYKM